MISTLQYVELLWSYNWNTWEWCTIQWVTHPRYTRKKAIDLSAPITSWTKELPITSSDALLLTYGRVQCSKRAAGDSNWKLPASVRKIIITSSTLRNSAPSSKLFMKVDNQPKISMHSYPLCSTILLNHLLLSKSLQKRVSHSLEKSKQNAS